VPAGARGSGLLSNSVNSGEPTLSDTPASLRELLDAIDRDRVALYVPEHDRRISFGALVSTIDRCGRRLRDLGVQRGDRVAFVLPNGPDFVLWILAMTGYGVTAAPLNPAYTTREFDFYLRDLAPRVLLVLSGQYAAARTAAAEADVRVADIEPGRWGHSAADGHTDALEEAADDDIALLLHTSGTTSRPKQVPLLHRNINASMHAIRDHYRLTEHDVSYCLMPLFHVHGLLASVYAALAAGGTVVIPERVSPSGFWRSLATDRVTWYSAAPTLHRMLLDKRPGDGAGTHQLRFVRSCSSPLPLELHERLEATLGAPVVQAYGMTEGSHQITSNPLPPRERRPASVGVAAGAEVALLAGGGVVAAGEDGEVVIRGPGVTPGYRNNPEANEEAFVDGWLRTGDLGSIDELGYLHLKGRIKELIIRGGENISPLEVEEALLRHPEVEQAVCFAVRDPKYGETVGAAVVARGEVSAADLRRHCAEHVASFKVPTAVVFVDAVPRTATGKPRRAEMAARFAADDGR
jgi:acyl-CoA synthetase (AMP-forming)/AMP-acid ligase II